MIIDTDVIIDYFKGVPLSKKILAGLENPAISVITYMELCQGTRSQTELNLVRQFLKGWDIKIFHINTEQSLKASFFMENFAHSHGLRLADALIAACCSLNNEPLLSGNAKHFSFIKEIEVKRYGR